VLPIIHEILEQDKTAPPKQRHTIKRIFDRLRTEHEYDGGISVVGDALRDWRAGTAEVFMPLSHPAGQAQVDFGEATVRLQGQETKVAYFVMALPFSDALFCQMFPRECTETFQEGHCRAFQFFGGVPTRISYDNSRIAVSKFVGRRGDTPTKEFLRLESHFLFEHHFCLVRRANEKGHVEGSVGFARRNFMVPVPQIDDLEEFNEQLTLSCRDDLQRRLRGQPTTKQGLLEEEQHALLPLLTNLRNRPTGPTAGSPSNLASNMQRLVLCGGLWSQLGRFPSWTGRSAWMGSPGQDSTPKTTTRSASIGELIRHSLPSWTRFFASPLTLVQMRTMPCCLDIGRMPLERIGEVNGSFAIRPLRDWHPSSLRHRLRNCASWFTCSMP
jgi:transposase